MRYEETLEEPEITGQMISSIQDDIALVKAHVKGHTRRTKKKVARVHAHERKTAPGKTKPAPAKREKISKTEAKKQAKLLLKVMVRSNLETFRDKLVAKHPWAQDIPIREELAATQLNELFYRVMKWPQDKIDRSFDAPTHAETLIYLSAASHDAPLTREANAEYQLSFLIVFGPKKFKEIFGKDEKVNMHAVEEFRMYQRFLPVEYFADEFYKPYRRYMAGLPTKGKKRKWK